MTPLATVTDRSIFSTSGCRTFNDVPAIAGGQQAAV
jgi:hypothetical protein